MRVLYLTKNGRRAASTRYRIEQFRPYLAQNGVEVEVEPLLDDVLLSQRFESGRYPLGGLTRAYWRRVRTLRSVSRRAYDLVVVLYEALPMLPAWLEWSLGLRRVPYVVEYDDAVFHWYDQARGVRRLLANKIARLMQRAAHIVAGNAYIAAYARRSGRPVTILPTVVDTTRYIPAPPTASGPAVSPRPITIGWIGSPSTAPFLRDIHAALQEVCKRHPHVRVVTVGSGSISLPGVRLDIREWWEDREIQDVQNFDIGIMPLRDDLWCRGKCGFKLIQYMACGVPVVASPVGVNVELTRHGETGFTAATYAEWVAALDSLVADATLRATLGTRGRALVETAYSVSVVAPRLCRLLRDAAGRS